jgi:hypothetical protein
MEEGWIPRFDSSNADRTYHRIALRLDLLPARVRLTREGSVVASMVFPLVRSGM